MPPDLIVTGHLEGASSTQPTAMAALHAAITTESARKAAGSVYAVAIHGISYTNMELVDFGTIGPVIGFVKSGSNNAVRQECRWIWRKLA
jgi:hypothetical protein